MNAEDSKKNVHGTTTNMNILQGLISLIKTIKINVQTTGNYL